MTKSTFVLGLNEAQCAGAALVRDGEIMVAASEERFTRIKNCWGFPKNAINFCLKHAKIDPTDLDLVVLSYIDPYPHFVEGRAKEKENLLPPLLAKIRDISPQIEYKLPVIKILADWGRSFYYGVYSKKLQKIQVREISKFLNLDSNKIIRINHHLCHAYTAYYANPDRDDEDTLVFTNDGAGDQISAGVYLVSKDKFRLLSSTSYNHSLGLFYSTITSILGLKAHEDEYKVMGLAPYARNSDFSKITKIFEKLIWVKDRRFYSKIPARHFGLYLAENLKNMRFDLVAAATQDFFEKLMTTWVRNAVRKNKVKSIACSGGSFLNVKANKLIMELPQVKRVFFMPSPSDDTNAIGACYYGHQLVSNAIPQPIKSLYLGPSYKEIEIVKALKKFPNLKVKKVKSIEKKIAYLLAEGKIVARFAGKMEMGARALGNRSILADPRRIEVKEEINKVIKMRDFWMPFAPTILEESAETYIINPGVDASYMILAFDTSEKGKVELAAATHPYDKTVRPQILKENDNHSYYKIIKDFEKLTGVGAVLNTSFNIHGEPIVASPGDALSTLMRSGLKYLAIENFLVTKNE